MSIIWHLKRVKRKLLLPRVLRKKVSCAVCTPRSCIALEHNGFNKVFQLAVSAESGSESIRRTLDVVWQRHYKDLFPPEQRVMIKINLNSSNPYPATTSPQMLEALLDLLRQQGVKDILVGACSANAALPTRKQARKTGILDTISGKADMVCFDEENWVTVPISGYHLKEVTVPEIVMSVSRIIALANMKTHSLADFTFGMKLAVGFLHPLERISLHQSFLHQKVVELQLAVLSDLTIIDGRLAFISGGPDEGVVAEAGVVLLGSNPVAVDLEAYKTLYTLKRRSKCLGNFAEGPYAMGQFSHAAKLGNETGLNGSYEKIEVH